MIGIQALVEEALATGYLSIAAENQLRSLLKSPSNSSELQAFWRLQEAARKGFVKQESKQHLSHLEIER